MAERKQKTTPSWAPSTYKQGSGGLFDNVDSTILDYEFVGDDAPENYKGSDKGIPLFLKVTHQIDGLDAPNVDWFSMGDKARENFEISEDGKTLSPLFEGAQIGGESNAGLFIGSFVTAGMPESLLESDDFNLGAIIDLGVHLERVPDTRDFAIKKAKDSKYPPQVLAVTRFSDETKAKWDGGKKTAAKKAAPAGKAAPAKTAGKTAPAEAAGGDDEVSALAQQTLLDILSENGGKLNRNKLIVPLSKKIGSLPAGQKDAIRKLAYSPEFLGQDDMGWTYNAATQEIKAD